MDKAGAALQVDVWSDYVCPFCYLELPVLSALQSRLAGHLEVRWHAFELRPDPVPTLDPDSDYLHDIWTRSVLPMARERGMTLKLPPLQPRSRLALAAAEFARNAGAFETMHHALFAAFFEYGHDIGDPDVLAEIAASVGLDAEAMVTRLGDGTLVARVMQDEADAAELGIDGVPLMLLRRNGTPVQQAQAFSGAQPLEILESACRKLLP